MAITFNPTHCPKHVYQLYGKWNERCIKCNLQNPEITKYNQQLVRAMESNDPVLNIIHPYVKDGRWGKTQHLRYMRAK